MCHVVLAVFLCHPVQHAAAAIIVEVHVNIGQRDTVGVEETLKQEVIFNGIDLRDAETVGHATACGGATAGSYAHVEFLAGGANEVLHNEEVARETHRLHNMQFKLDALGGFLI